MGEVVTLFKEDSPMYRWIKTTQYMRNKYGPIKTNTWIKEHVPEQLREAVIKQL